MRKIILFVLFGLGLALFDRKHEEPEHEGHTDESLLALKEDTEPTRQYDRTEVEAPRTWTGPSLAGSRPYVAPAPATVTPRIFSFRADLATWNGTEDEGKTVYTVNVSGPASFVQQIADALAAGVNENIDGMQPQVTPDES